MRTIIAEPEQGIAPCSWYDITYLVGAHGIPRSHVRGDSKQIKLITQSGSVKYLGASILNLGLRLGHITPEELPNHMKYVHPVLLAQRLELPARDLALLKSGDRSLVSLVEHNGHSDYKVDISLLHHFSFEPVDHRGVSSLSKGDLIRKYRLSGRHKDYSDALMAAYYSWLDKQAEQVRQILDTRYIESSSSLLAAAFLGFHEALDAYSFVNGASFNTFARKRVRGAIFDDLRKSDYMSRLLRSRIKRVGKFSMRFAAEHRRMPTSEEIIANLGLTPSQYQEIIPLLAATTLSLSAPVELVGENAALSSTIADPRSDFTKEADKLARSEMIGRALGTLNPIEQEVMLQYYWECRSMREIGALHKLTESRICQINAVAIERLKGIVDLEELL